MSIDLIQRTLTSFFDVSILHAMGMTDIDDKIINKSRELANLSKSPLRNEYKKLVGEMEYKFWDDLRWLGVKRPNSILRFFADFDLFW